MTIQFPDSPSQGETFEASNGVLYTYDSGGWTANNPNGLNDLYVEVGGDTMTGKLTLNSTDAIKIPAGTTAQRPSGIAGDYRFNSETSYPEYFNGSNWVSTAPTEIKTLDAGGWGGSNPNDPGSISQQFVPPGPGPYSFDVRPITLTPGIWMVTANVWGTLGPNIPPNNSVHVIHFEIPYSSSRNAAITYSSKADAIISQQTLTIPHAVELPLVCTFAINSDITFNSINGYWSSASDNNQRDLKMNCWYTAIKLS